MKKLKKQWYKLSKKTKLLNNNICKLFIKFFFNFKFFFIKKKKYKNFKLNIKKIKSKTVDLSNSVI